MSALKPDFDSTHDLGTTSLRWRNLFVDTITTTETLSVGTDLTVEGNLTVNGNTTTLSTTELVISDKTITLSNGAADSLAADGAGVIIDGAEASLLYSHAGTQWELNKALEVQGNIFPQADDSFTLGTVDLGWENVFITHGGVITFSNEAADASDLTLSHSTNLLTISGGNVRVDRLEIDSATDYVDMNGLNLAVVSSADLELTPAGSLVVSSNIIPSTDDGSSLGVSGTAWSDIYLASGATIDFDESDVIITHSESLLNVSGGNVRVDRLEIDSAADYVDMNGSNLAVVSSADLELTPGGGDVKVSGNIVPQTADGGSLGSADLEWSDLYLSDGGIIKLGNDQEVTLTHVPDTGLLLNSTNKLQLGDAGSFVHQSADGVLTVSTDGAVQQALKLIASDASGGVFIDAGTGGLHVDSEGRFLVEGSGSSSKIELATGSSDNVDLTLSLVGGGNSSILLSSSGTGVDAIGLNASAGGIDLEASGDIVVESSSGIVIGKDGVSSIPVTLNSSTLDINGTGALTVTSTSMSLDPSTTFDLDAAGAVTIDAASITLGGDADTGAISLTSSSADLNLSTSTAGNIVVDSINAIDLDSVTGITVNTSGAAADISLGATAGSITLDAGQLASDAIKINASGVSGGIDIDSGTSGFDLDSTGQIALTSSKDDASAILIQSTAGGIDITATGTAGEDIDISALGSSVNISSTETDSSAISLTATTGAGGIDINAGSSGVDVDSSGQIALTSTQAASDAVVVEATNAAGGIDLSVGGQVIVSIDSDSVDISQDAVFSEDIEVQGGRITLSNGATIDSETEGELILTEDLVKTSGDLTATGDLTVQGGKITLSNGATIDSETEGELILTEDLVKTSGDLTVVGNLTVQGETTTVNTATLDVEDKNVTLNKGGAANSATSAGINFEENSVITGYLRVADDDRTNLDLKAPGGSELKLDVNSDSTFTVGANLTVSGNSDVNQDLTTDADVTFNSVDADGGVTVDSLTLDGQSLSLSAGDFTLDVAGDIILDADGGNLRFADGGTDLLGLSNSASNVFIKPLVEDKDIVFTTDADVEIVRLDSDAESLLISSGKRLQLGAPEEAIYGDGTDIHFEVGTGGDINVPSDVGVTFGDDGEKIEGNGTDLTISSSNDLNLNATSSVVIPSGVTLEFVADSGESISGNGTDLTLNSGGDIYLSATNAVSIPSEVKLNFDGTDLGDKAIFADLDSLNIKSAGNRVEVIASDLSPSSDSSTSLGVSGLQWQKLWVDDVELSGQGKLLLDGTSASIFSDSSNEITFETDSTRRLVLNTTSLYPMSPEASPITLGTATEQFDGLFLYQGKSIDFRDSLDTQDVTISHVVNEGLNLKNHTGSALRLTLQNSDSDVSLGDVLGQIDFQAPNEGTGSDANLVAASIAAVSEGDFAADSNATKLSFMTGSSETASEKMSLSSAGVLTLNNSGIVIPDSSTIGSTSASDAISINSAGDIQVSSTTGSTSPTTGSLKVSGGLGVAENLNIAGATELDGTLKIVLQDFTIANAAGSVERFKVAGSSGNTEIAGTLEVDGNCTLGNANSDLHTINGGLTITGVSTTSNVLSGGARNMDGSEYVYLVTADNVTITLPSISGAEAAAGQRFIIKRTAAHSAGVTINRDGTDLIDGGTSVTLGAEANGVKSFIEIISDGTNYHIITAGGTVTVS